MSENAAINLDVNASGAVASINELITSVRGVGTAAKEAAKGMEQIDGGKGVDALTAKQKSLAAEIARVTDKQIAQTRAYGELEQIIQKGNRKGVDLAPLVGDLAGLRQASSELTALQQKTAALAAIEKSAQSENAHWNALKDQWAASNKSALDAETARVRVYESAVRSAKLEMLSLGKSASEKAQIRGDLFGIDPAVVAKQVASIKEIEASQLAAATAAQALAAKGGAAMNTLHGSTKAYSAALRQVPAQFTDIIVSLQGGQAPLTVLLQQGGQLKDVFGGVGAAAKALGSYIMGLINPWTLAAGAAALLATAYTKGAAEAEAYNKALIMTGNYAGTTATQMIAMAKAISSATGGTVGAAAEAMAALASTGDIAASQFTKLGAATVAWSKATGESVESIAKQFSKLQDEPLKATLALNDSQHYLTRSIYDQIKALEEQGRMLEAGVVAQNAWSDAINQRAPLLVENLGIIETAWRGVTGTAKAAWDAMLNVGRSTDPVSAIKTRISELENLLKNPRTGKIEAGDNQSMMGQRYLEELSLMNRKLALQEKGAGYEAMSAAYQRDEAKATEAKVAWDKEHDKYLSKQVQMQREIAKAQALYSQQRPEDQNTEKYAETIAGIQKKYAETAKHVKSASDAYMTLYDSVMKNNAASLIDLETGRKVTAGENERLESLKQIEAQLRKGKIGIVESEVLKSIAAETAANRALAESRKESAKMLDASTKASQKYYADLANNNDALEKSNAKLAEENALFGLSEESKNRMILARQDHAIAIEQEAFALLNLQNSSEIEVATAQRRIDLMKEQRGLTASGIVAKEAKVAADEWKKTAESIRDSLTDAFMSAIDGTKSLWVSLRDSVVGMFKNMVLRPIIQGVVGAGVSAVAGSAAASAMGFGSSAAGAAAGASMPGGITSLLGSSSMGALDIMGFDPTTLAIGAALLVLSQMGGKFVSAADSGRASIDYTSAGIGGAAYNTTGDAAQIAAATANTNALAKTYFDTASALGVKAMQAAFEVGTNTGREGAAPQTVLGVNIGKASYSSGEIASGDAAALQLASSRAILTALQASDMPRYLAGVFDNITASTATQDQITAALTSAGALATFNKELLALPFANLAALSYSATQSLIKFSGGLDTLKSNLSTYYTNFYTAEEQRLQTIANINKATAGSGLDAATATRESFRKIVEAQDLSTESGQKMYAALISVSGAFAGLTPALSAVAATVTTTVDALQVAMARAQNANAVADSAMAALTASIDAEKSALSQKYESDLSALTTAQDAYTQSVTASISSISASVGSLQSLSNRLKSSLANPLAGTDGQQRQSAQALIASVLAIAKSGGGLPKDTTALESALSTVSKPSQALFGSFEDYARDFYKTSTDIAALSDITDTTLTAQQQMLAQLEAQSAISKAAYSSQAKLLKAQYDQAVKGLDTTLASAQKQLDALHGIDTSVLSVSAAIDRLAAALGAAKTTQATSNAVTDDTIRGYIANLKTGGGTEADMVITLAKRSKEVGVTQADIARAMGMTEVDVASYFASFGIPKFAQGTNYVPNDMVAMVHEGEAIIPKAYNPSAANTGNSDTAAALRALADRLDRIEANTRATAGHTAGTDRKLARVIPGNALITEAAV